MALALCQKRLPATHVWSLTGQLVMYLYLQKMPGTFLKQCKVHQVSAGNSKAIRSKLTCASRSVAARGQAQSISRPAPQRPSPKRMTIPPPLSGHL